MKDLFEILGACVCGFIIGIMILLVLDLVFKTGIGNKKIETQISLNINEEIFELKNELKNEKEINLKLRDNLKSEIENKCILEKKLINKLLDFLNE